MQGSEGGLAKRMIDEEHPAAVRKPAMHFHAVMMHLGALAGLVDAGDQPLQVGHGKVSSYVV